VWSIYRVRTTHFTVGKTENRRRRRDKRNAKVPIILEDWDTEERVEVSIVTEFYASGV
jgi:hypothetical protein